MKTSDKLMGKNRENIPNWAFKLMAFVMKVMDVFWNYSNNNFKTLGIQKGQTVIDYGCGPARYIRSISITIGNEGKLIATDIHPLAIKKVKEKIKRFKLQNTEAALSKEYNSPINNDTADVVLALDMFHMIQNPDALLNEFKRILKPDGIAIIEDGHQPREETKLKVMTNRNFEIIEENKNHIKCKII